MGPPHPVPTKRPVSVHKKRRVSVVLVECCDHGRVVRTEHQDSTTRLRVGQLDSAELFRSVVCIPTTRSNDTKVQREGDPRSLDGDRLCQLWKQRDTPIGIRVPNYGRRLVQKRALYRYNVDKSRYILEKMPKRRQVEFVSKGGQL